MNRNPHITVTHISFLISVCITILLWTFSNLTRDWLTTPIDLHQEIANILKPHDSTSQRLGHRLAILLIAFSACALLVLIKLRKLRLPIKPKAFVSRIILQFERPDYRIVWLLFLIVFTWRWHGNVIPVLLSFVLLAAVAHVLRNFDKSIADLIWSSFFILFVFIYLILPILMPLDFSEFTLTKYIFLIELHYSSVLGSAESLAQGGILLDNVSINYGVFFPVLIAIYKTSIGAFELSDYLRLQQLLNGLFFLIIICSLNKYTKGQKHIILLVAMMILPWINNIPEWISTPNQTGMRYLAFSFVLLFLTYSKKYRAPKNATIAGGLSALSILLNTETGFIISVGLSIFIFFSNDLRNWFSCLTSYFLFGIAFLSLMIAFWLGASILLPHPPQFNDLNSVLIYFLRFFGGYAGVKTPTLSHAFIFLVHSGFVVIFLISRWDFTKLIHRDAVRITISLFILGWLAYYFNRSELRNLWLVITLYGFLLTPLLSRRYLGMFLNRFPSSSVPIPILALALFIVPMLIKENQSSLMRSYNHFIPTFLSDSSTKSAYSGIKLKTSLVRILDRKVQYLKSLPYSTSFAYASAFSFTMPLVSKRRNFDIPQDVFNEVLTKSEHNIFMNQLEKNGPNLLLFDDYDQFGEEVSYWRSFYARMQKSIKPFYKIMKVQDGWRIYQRQ